MMIVATKTAVIELIDQISKIFPTHAVNVYNYVRVRLINSRVTNENTLYTENIC